MMSAGGFTVERRSDIRSSLSPFWVADCKIRYPECVCGALGTLYAEYNKAFGVLVEANREWAEDYQYAIGRDGVPCNFAVQIDMLGLDDEFLRAAIWMREERLREEMRRRVFEIENSLAMYQLLEKLFSTEREEGFFKKGWRMALNELRSKYDKQIALLAVTDQKYEAMCQSEFGKQVNERLSDLEVFELSGFDRFFSPEDFQALAIDERDKYLLFVRSSDPTSKLRNPKVVVGQPLLSDSEMRRFIKANAVTFNIDNPERTGVYDRRRINDTKWYMPSMGMAYPLVGYEDLGLGRFVSYLESFGINPDDVRQGKQALRFKPAQGTYGCYGHLKGVLTDKKLRQELRTEISRRGPYMVQPEMELPVVVGIDSQKYTYIDRIFLAIINSTPTFIGGFRSLMPLGSSETRAGRNHGSKDTVWAEITL